MLRTIFLDFETYYDDEYSLRKMTPVEYVLDPRFECHGCAIKEEIDGTPYWLDGPDLPAFFSRLDPRVTSLVTHNALFDMCIVAWRYGFIPRLMVDTLGVARATVGHVLKSLSLSSVATHLGIGVKGNALLKVKGMPLALIKAQPQLYQEYVQYALDDVSLCAGIYDKLVRSGRFPIKEIAVMDMVLRCTVQPKFRLCLNTLHEHYAEVMAEKERLLGSVQDLLSNGKTDLMSNERFAEVLRSLGVEPPMKVSATTDKLTYAFAKTDHEFIDLQEHEDPRVQALVSARLGHKSTIEETRCERLIKIANVTWPGNEQRLMPMPLRFSGAHTHRLSGDWKINPQNLGRGSKLRRALIAPSNHQVFAIDSSQIEARLVAWISGQWDLVAAFSRGDDVYSMFASNVFGMPVNKKDHPKERFVGKQAILGLGYGLGHRNFRIRLKADSRNQLGQTLEISEDESQRIVNTYRTLYNSIPTAWRMLESMGISTLVNGGEWVFGPCIFEQGTITLPGNLPLRYHDLRQADGEWVFTYAGKPRRLYGGAILENICQYLARILIMDAALRIRQRTGHTFALQVHDELVYVIPEAEVEGFGAIAHAEMTRRPTWGPDLPLAAEYGVGPNYGEAK